MPQDTPAPIAASRLRTVRISVPEKYHNDAAKMREVMEQALAKLGCRAYHSGFDIRFIRQAELTVLDRGGEFEIHSAIER